MKSVALESTGVYWIPVVEISAERRIGNLAGGYTPPVASTWRKTDVIDGPWIQTLHSHGLLQSSYHPSEQMRPLRSLVRQKAVLVREQADWMRRMHKCLDQMNVRVHHAVSDR